MIKQIDAWAGKMASHAIVRDQDGYVHYANEYSEWRFGDLLGKPFVDAISPEIETPDINLWVATDRQVIETEEPVTDIISTYEKNGRTILSRAHKLPLDGGKVMIIGSEIESPDEELNWRLVAFKDYLQALAAKKREKKIKR